VLPHAALARNFSKGDASFGVAMATFLDLGAKHMATGCDCSALLGFPSGGHCFSGKVKCLLARDLGAGGYLHPDGGLYGVELPRRHRKFRYASRIGLQLPLLRLLFPASRIPYRRSLLDDRAHRSS
jgi:hypothetical protein